jgi:hypothetical protein
MQQDNLIGISLGLETMDRFQRCHPGEGRDPMTFKLANPPEISGEYFKRIPYSTHIGSRPTPG